MKRIDFEYVEGKNFLSIGNDPIRIPFKQGIHIITGWNEDKQSRNGVGKSTVVDMLVFLLFGKTSRKINLGTIVNNKTRKDCVVTGQFRIGEDTYRIIRSLKPSKVIIEKNGKPYKKGVSESQEDIDKLIGYDYDMFLQTEVMTALNTTSFLSKPPAKKTEFVESALGMGVFEILSKDSKSRLKATSDKFDKKKYEVSVSTKLVGETRTKKDDHDDQIKAKIVELEEKRETAKRILADAKKESADLPDDPASFRDDKNALIERERNGNTKIQEVKDRMTGIRNEKTNLTKDLQNYSDSKTFCPHCKRPYENLSTDHFQIERDKINASISALSGEYSELEEKLAKFENAITKIKAGIRNYADKETAWKNAEAEIVRVREKTEKAQKVLDQVDAVIDSTRKTPNPFIKFLEEQQEQLDKLEAELSEISEEYEIDKLVQAVFAPEGFKAFLVRKILATFNSRVNYYLKKLNSPCMMKFNEYFEEEIFNDSNEVCPYDMFSGGERKRIDFALMFAFRDIRKLQAGISSNVGFFDELFDSALDDVGMEDVLGILRSQVKENNEAVYIVTHRKENLSIPDAEIIRLVKKNGLTTLSKPS